MLLFDLGRRRWNLWFMQAVCGAFAGAMLLLAYIAPQMRSEVTGELLPLGIRWAAAVLLGLLGLVVFAASIAYGARYVSRIERSGDRILVTTMIPFGMRHIGRAIEDVTVGIRYAGRMAGRPSLRTPWRTLRIRGLRFPFMIDMQGSVLDENVLLAINDTNA